MTPLHGLLLIDKPTGVTSHDVVHRVRKITGIREIGHTGTLDPLASGLLVLVVGEGTKIAGYLSVAEKAYRVKAKLGLTTDSYDITGEVTSRSDFRPSKEMIEKEVLGLSGPMDLAVPAFSAVKVKGKKLYEMARKNQVTETPMKAMDFFDLKILDIASDSVELEMRCSKGSYVRSWVFELGRRLECGATVEALRRLDCVPYSLEPALSLEQLEASEDISQSSAYIPLAQALVGWKTLTIQGKDERLMLNGQISHDLSRRLIVEQKTATQEQKVIGIKVLSARGPLIAILEAQPLQGLKIRRIFKSL